MKKRLAAFTRFDSPRQSDYITDHILACLGAIALRPAVRADHAVQINLPVTPKKTSAGQPIGTAKPAWTNPFAPPQINQLP